MARDWGSPSGGVNGMAIAVAFFAETLERLGHQVRRSLELVDSSADLAIATITPTWRRTVARAEALGMLERLVYWHHASGLPKGYGRMLVTAPAIAPGPDWGRHVVLPPSSWAADSAGACTGGDIVVAGAAPAKGGHLALEVARLCPDLRWYVLKGRSAATDRAPWRELPHAVAAEDAIAPAQFLARARVVLSPTRFETYGLTLVEAAVRGIPVVCTDLPALRASLGSSAIYVHMNAPAAEWAQALRQALDDPPPRLRLPPYATVVAEAIERLRS